MVRKNKIIRVNHLKFFLIALIEMDLEKFKIILRVKMMFKNKRYLIPLSIT